MKKTYIMLLCVLLGIAWATAVFAGGKKESSAPEETKAVTGGGVLKTYATLQDYEKATGNKITKFNEAPMLEELVKAGKLPSLEDRLPDEPMVISPKDQIGKYGGTLTGAGTGPSGGGADIFLSRGQPLVILLPDMKTVVPNIIKGWDFSDNNKVFTAYLRKGMKYSDGASLTADDYMFWYNDILLNESIRPVKPSRWAPGGTAVKLQKIDDYTVRFTFPIPYPVILDLLAVSVEQ